jgi:hypothetical protein
MPQEPLTESRVIVMMKAEIEMYDAKQDRRHRENQDKLEKISSELAGMRGAKDYRQWLFPMLTTVGLIAVGILQVYHGH